MYHARLSNFLIFGCQDKGAIFCWYLLNYSHRLTKQYIVNCTWKVFLYQVNTTTDNTDDDTNNHTTADTI